MWKTESYTGKKKKTAYRNFKKLEKLRNYTMFMGWKILQYYNVSLCHTDLSSQCPSNQNPKTFFWEISRLILKVTWKGKRRKIQKTILKENKFGRPILPEFNNTLTMAMWYWRKYKHIDKWNRKYWPKVDTNS